MRFTFLAGAVSALVAAILVDQAAGQTCTCSTLPQRRAQTFTQDEVQRALIAGFITPIPPRGYPHRFNNREGISFDSACTVAGTRLFEYRLKGGDTAWAPGSSPGPDRVIYSQDGEFCGCITHPSKTSNGFVACNWT